MSEPLLSPGSKSRSAFTGVEVEYAHSSAAASSSSAAAAAGTAGSSSPLHNRPRGSINSPNSTTVLVSSAASMTKQQNGYVALPTSDHQVQDQEQDPEEELKEGKRKTNPSLSMRRLLAQAKPETGILVVATICLFFGTVSSLVIPTYVGKIIDAISKTDDEDGAKHDLYVAVVVLGVASAVSSAFSFFRAALYTIAGERVVARLRNQLFRAIIRQEIGMFDVTRTGELINRLSADTSVLKDAVTTNVSMSLRWGATIILGIAYLFYVSWKLTLVMLSVVPIVAVGGRYYGKYVREVSKATQDALAKATETAEESYSNIRTVRSFAQEPRQVRLYAERIADTYALGKKLSFAYGGFTAAISFIATAAVVLVLFYGGLLVIKGEMSAGVLTSFILYTLTVGVAFGGLSGLFGEFMKAIGANERVFQLLDRVPAIPLPHIDIEKGALPLTPQQIADFRTRPLKGLVEFHSVKFAYPSRTMSLVLNDFSLTLKPGTVTALVGPSGGGKTTVVSLIERFYDPDHGRITVDGVDLRDLDPSVFRRHVGLVSQEPVLFASTIKENISYGIPEEMLASMPDLDQRIVEAAQMANAHDFINSFKHGYDTLVGERGIRLSGGQKQRVAIARAILLNPTILLLDEATSALDSESEHLVQEALDRLMKGRTVLVIAHRLSTVKNAHNVVVVHQGRSLEQGTHDELIARSGLYAKLVRRQLSAAENDASSRSRGPSLASAADHDDPASPLFGENEKKEAF